MYSSEAKTIGTRLSAGLTTCACWAGNSWRQPAWSAYSMHSIYSTPIPVGGRVRCIAQSWWRRSWSAACCNSSFCYNKSTSWNISSEAHWVLEKNQQIKISNLLNNAPINALPLYRENESICDSHYKQGLHSWKSSHILMICKTVNALNKYRAWWRRSREQHDWVTETAHTTQWACNMTRALMLLQTSK